MVGVVNAMTGWDTDIWELLEVGKRGATLARLYNLREGFTSKDDSLPKRFFEGFRNDNSATGKPLDRAELDQARKAYYRLMGWDDEGVPTAETLEKAGLGEYAALAAGYNPTLDRRGVAGHSLASALVAGPASGCG